ncbi:MAG: helix-turn-helix transcriptional regulator [Prevotellaceae bacterium]|jgi:DNA-binding CsgD family transcriptional regulator|nr:helix-turn-helix transcriptional regulator [Prevotellaceae bacterium]
MNNIAGDNECPKEVSNERLLTCINELLDRIVTVEKRPCFVLCVTQDKLYYVSDHFWLLGESGNRTSAYKDGASYLRRIFSTSDYQRFVRYYQIISEDVRTTDVAMNDTTYYSFVMETKHNHLFHSDYSTFKHFKVFPVVFGERVQGLFYILSPSIDRVFTDLNQSSRTCSLTHTKDLLRHERKKHRYQVYDLTGDSWGNKQKYPHLIHSQRELLSYLKSGRSASWIANIQDTTSGSIRNRLNIVYRKLGVANIQEALCIIDNFPLV